MSELKRCLAESPTFATAWGDLGYLHEMRGESMQAIDCYKRYIELVPTDPAPFERMGDCFLSMRKRSFAYRSYLNAASIVSDPPASLYEKIARAEPLLTKMRRRGIPIIRQFSKRLFNAEFLKAFSRELIGLPFSVRAIRDSGFPQFLGYLNQHYLNGDWYQHSILPCDLCGSRRTVPVFFCGTQKSVRCRNCGLEFVERKPPESLDVFTHSFDREDTIRHFEKEWSTSRIHDHRCQEVQGLFQHAGVKMPGRGSRALEIGCGQGAFLMFLREAGMKVEGIETAAKLVEHCRNQNGLEVYLATIRSFERAPESYDLIAAFHVLEHLEKPSELFQKAYNLLMKGGFLILEIPTPDLSGCTYIQRMHPHHGYANAGHLHYFTPATAAKYFERYGFDLIATYEYRSDALPSGGFLGQKRDPQSC